LCAKRNKLLGAAIFTAKEKSNLRFAPKKEEAALDVSFVRREPSVRRRLGG
jgi:hypothetical protein